MWSWIHWWFLRWECVPKKQCDCRTQRDVEHYEYGICVARG